MAHLSREELQDVRAAEQQRATGTVSRGSGIDFSRSLEALAGLIGLLTVEGGGRKPGILPLRERKPAAVPSVIPGDAAARKKQRTEQLRRRGRRSTILSGGAGVIGEAPLSQPQALGG